MSHRDAALARPLPAYDPAPNDAPWPTSMVGRARKPSRPRLQAAVAERRPDETDPYADVPCTD
ncbi:MAG: hypothetical protein KC657_21115 [Myxococcales bacterium]|nr:hypothetical protein [Myxococcales bacterium]